MIKDIPGFEGLYGATEMGEIVSLQRKVSHPKCGMQTINQKILKKRVNARGYYYVVLSKGGVSKSFTVHRLVAKSWLDYRDELSVNHISGDKLDNRVSNLEWITYEENRIHARDILGTHKGSKNPKATLNDSQVLEIRNLLGKGISQKDIGNKFKVDQTTVSNIKVGKTWGHL